MADFKPIIELVNRKATFQYHLRVRYISGMVLQGTEIKSIRHGKANLSDAYCEIRKGELYVKNLHISEYKQGSYNNHEPKRPRKLLLNKRELKKLDSKVKEKGFTIIPVRLFISERGFAKLEIALAQGKNTYDKRHSIKNKDTKREMDRAMKGF